MMDSFRLKNNKKKTAKRENIEIAEKIFRMLNQGGLFEIYQVMGELHNEEERQQVIDTFIVQYKFNFIEHI